MQKEISQRVRSQIENAQPSQPAPYLLLLLISQYVETDDALIAKKLIPLLRKLQPGPPINYYDDEYSRLRQTIPLLPCLKPHDFKSGYYIKHHDPRDPEHGKILYPGPCQKCFYRPGCPPLLDHQFEIMDEIPLQSGNSLSDLTK